MKLRGNRGMGYVRLDWFTPDGLGTWGDGRLFVLGTEGYIELRKYVDVAVKNAGNNLFIVDRKEARAARNGHVGAAEQKGIQGSENRQSGRIYRKKHN